VKHTWWDDDEATVFRDAVENGTGFDGVDEYDPAGDDRYNLPGKAEEVQILEPLDTDGRRSRIEVQRWTAEKKEIDVLAAAPVRVGLRLLNYPAWRVEVNGKQIVPQHPDDTGQMIIQVDRGQSHVSVWFTRTWDRMAGGVMSLLSLAVAILLLVRRSG
jgi:hypothetical protein